ncbi:putative AMP-binding enzyme [Aspergillus saccharolyticus JOP 1030-1]|uniref:AMP-binding enzyme n=1 Tax=Aspergillus saccharolyticus JOP 1030-1 TaxID=1450539 RepID=A0A318Z008_9EURO|nr:AMP-binding enzyme [Aspergillus saccharolyticus JOP 1030-1]PYH40575.1 AMP-binding enzyme [Aspergillus saccharolyticus JOP 1030-1]
MEQTSPFPLPGIYHGQRFLATVVETRAQDNSPWVSVPIDETDLSRGFRDISFQQLNNAANHAAHWLQQNLPATTEPFQCFAYAGPKDFLYPILAVAAAKIQKVIVLPSPLITPEAQLRIFRQKKCTVYLRPASMAEHVAGILQEAPEKLQTLTVPELGEFMQDAEAAPYTYPKSWEEGKDDPWIVFHTSGTTGFPKPITYTHRMMTAPDIAASLSDIENTHVHQYALQRWYTPLPSLHLTGTVMTLAMTSFVHMTAVVGPSAAPTPQLVADILRYGQVDGALLTPALIEELCLLSSGLEALRKLKYIHFAGAPLSPKAGAQLASHVHLVPCIGSTEAGGYFTTIPPRDHPSWDYVTFQKHAGAEFEHRFNDLHELVFVRRPDCPMQQIFSVYPDRDRFETNDLWVEHPDQKGSWKIIGRTDDYVALAHADGLHASLLEPEIESHPAVKTALIGGHGRPAPVLVVEFFPEAEEGVLAAGQSLVDSLRPYIDKVNARVHDCVKLSTDRVVVASKDKPFVRTIKGSVARLQTLGLYEEEIAALFERE